MLLRTDPSHHRLYYLSIPRDLAGADPGLRHAEDQRRVPDRRRRARDPDDPRVHRRRRSTTSIVVNFADFKDLIDALGGIDVNVPKPIRSNRFDCPYATQARCDQWQGWRFEKGKQHMNGERALIYSRIRENMLDPSRDRLHARRAPAGRDGRGRVEAHLARDAACGCRSTGGSFVEAAHHRPRRRASSSQLGWVKFRASGSSSVHCRLGGDLGGGGTGAPERGQPRDARDVPRQVGAAAADRPVRSRLRHRPPAAVAVAAWASSPAFCSACSPVSSRALVTPGRHRDRVPPTLAVGLVGALLGGLIGNVVLGHKVHSSWDLGPFLLAVVGAVVLLLALEALAGSAASALF